MIKLGEKIKALRKQRNISQEVLANYLGVSFQSVSKWETDATMPDVALIPAIASFFEVSIDELFDYNRMEAEKKVEEICDEAYKYRMSDPAKSEEILRDGLKQFPGNDIILNNLLYVIDTPERVDEVISLCKSLIESTNDDTVKYDVLRILAGAYKAVGDYSSTKDTIEKIPELYFSKLGVAAWLLEGEDMFKAAVKHRSVALDDLLDMCVLLADYYIVRGEKDKAKIQLETALNVYNAFEKDYATAYTRSLYEAFSDRAAEIESKLSNL